MWMLTHFNEGEIHRSSPAFTQLDMLNYLSLKQEIRLSIFWLRIIEAEKIGLLGGAGVGKTVLITACDF